MLKKTLSAGTRVLECIADEFLLTRISIYLLSSLIHKTSSDGGTYAGSARRFIKDNGVLAWL